jgi:hypothetical protein
MRHVCSSDSKTSRHHLPKNWHSETEVLFTMSRERAEGESEVGVGVGVGVRDRSKSRNTTQADDVSSSH